MLLEWNEMELNGKETKLVVYKSIMMTKIMLTNKKHD